MTNQTFNKNHTPIPSPDELLTETSKVYPTTLNMFRDLCLEVNFDSYREVVVITPFGAYNQPQELGRYEGSAIAYKIMESFPDMEFKVFYLDNGEEVQRH